MRVRIKQIMDKLSKAPVKAKASPDAPKQDQQAACTLFTPQPAAGLADRIKRTIAAMDTYLTLCDLTHLNALVAAIANAVVGKGASMKVFDSMNAVFIVYLTGGHPFIDPLVDELDLLFCAEGVGAAGGAFCPVSGANVAQLRRVGILDTTTLFECPSDPGLMIPFMRAIWPPLCKRLREAYDSKGKNAKKCIERAITRNDSLAYLGITA